MSRSSSSTSLPVHTKDSGFLTVAIFILFLLCSVSPSTVSLFTARKLNAHDLCTLRRFWWMPSATYRPGIWTTAFSVIVSGSVWMQIFLKWWRGRQRKKKRLFLPMWTGTYSLLTVSVVCIWVRKYNLHRNMNKHNAPECDKEKQLMLKCLKFPKVINSLIEIQRKIVWNVTKWELFNRKI